MGVPDRPKTLQPLKKPSKLAKLAKKLSELQQAPDIGCPLGWMSVRQIQQRLRFISLGSASTRAKTLANYGLLDRIKYKVKAESGQVTWCYAYKPKKPHLNFDDVMIAAGEIGQDKVPRGWVSVSDFIKLACISRSAVFQMAERNGLGFKYFRVKNGAIGGIKPVTHFRLSSLKKLHHLKG